MNTLNKRISLITYILISTVVLNIVGCDHNEHHKIKSKYLVTHPWKESLIIDEEYVAQIKAIQHIEVRAFEKGYLDKIYVDEGQSIEKDQEMFQIMPLLMKAEYDKAKAEYDIANIEFKNTRSLARKKVVSGNEFALAKANLNKAKAELDLAKTHLDFTTIKAPFNGIMDRFEVRLGSLIEEGELLTTLSDNSKMWVYFNVSESDYLDYMDHKKNAEAELPLHLKLANGKIFSQTGKIDTIEADFNNETGNVAFRATFLNPDGLLRHGETGNIILSKPLDNVLVIPQKATFEILNKKFVYVIDKNHKVQSRQITIAQEVPHLFVVESGLETSDQVLIEGLGKIQTGEEVETKIQAPKDVMASLNLPLD